MKNTVIAILSVPFLIAGCTTTNTVPIAPDTFRLDTSASGALFAGTAGETTFLKAAHVTKAHGHAYFKILNSASGNGSTYAGSSVNVIGNTLWTSPTYAPTQDVSLVVQMLDAPEKGAWNVDDVIARKGKMF